MNEVLFVILRRLRRPLIALIVAYAVSVWGLVLIPGVDEHGNVVRMGFFHALYFISYTSTTIGFGEPAAFSDPQRAWTVVCIYLCVVAWAYALGAGGQAGVTEMLGTLRAELEVAMSLTGCTDVRKAGRELLVA